MVILVAVLGCLLGPASPQAEAATAVRRIMVYGDSVTQGSSGDWTWRCRLWRGLRAGSTDVDLVGPRRDLWAWRTGHLGSSAYADPGCDRDHAALWGVQFSNPGFDLSTMALASRADVVVGMMGQNDLLDGSSAPAQLVNRWRSEISQIRASRPDTDFVFVQDPDVWLTGSIADYNARLVSLARSLSTARSRVVASANPNFDRVRDTVDDMHPSANGEVRIAFVVANALRSVGVGRGWPGPLRTVLPGPGLAPTPRVASGAHAIGASWGLSDYADAERVWWRDTTAGGAWHVSSTLGGTSWKIAAKPGHSYAVRMQPRKGRHFSGTRSRIELVRVPARPSAVSHLSVRHKHGCRARVSWRAAAFATSYRVTVRRVSATGQTRNVQVRTARATSMRTIRLRHRARYDVSVRSFGPLMGASTAPVVFRGC
ncbi:MAG: lipolytic protein family [Marmoricola sp.]|nr:lipolytic protein family [Marmoricola sp.]